MTHSFYCQIIQVFTTVYIYRYQQMTPLLFIILPTNVCHYIYTYQQMKNRQLYLCWKFDPHKIPQAIQSNFKGLYNYFRKSSTYYKPYLLGHHDAHFPFFYKIHAVCTVTLKHTSPTITYLTQQFSQPLKLPSANRLDYRPANVWTKLGFGLKQFLIFHNIVKICSQV